MHAASSRASISAPQSLNIDTAVACARHWDSRRNWNKSAVEKKEKKSNSRGRYVGSGVRLCPGRVSSDLYRNNTAIKSGRERTKIGNVSNNNVFGVKKKKGKKKKKKWLTGWLAAGWWLLEKRNSWRCQVLFPFHLILHAERPHVLIYFHHILLLWPSPLFFSLFWNCTLRAELRLLSG